MMELEYSKEVALVHESSSYIDDIVKNDLSPLLSAIEFYISMTSPD